MSTTTDSSGRFDFAMLAAGTYMLRVRRVGLTSAKHVVQIVNDDNRGITLKMYALSPRTERATARQRAATD